ncbi:alpha/beta fold hydrolase [Pseudomonadota bacterium]
MSVISVNGIDVDVIQEGQGRDLVLLHTLLADRSVYDAVIPELAKHRRVTRINFPGYGASGDVGPEMKDYADLVAATMKELGLPVETDVLGNGFGGFVAGTLAIHHGDIFDKLVLVDTGAGFPEPDKKPLRFIAGKVGEEGMVSILDAAVNRMFPEIFVKQRPDIISTRKERLTEARPEMFVNAIGALIALDNRPHLAKIKNKTLVVVGLEDKTTPPSLSSELVSGIDGAELVELPGLGHCPQLQDPAAFLTGVGNFLELPG